MSVTNIRKHSGDFRRRARWLRNFAAWRTPFRSQRLISQPAKLAFSLVWSTFNGSNFFISTPNCAPFEALDWWLPELQNDSGSRKCSKSGWQWLSFWMLHGGFLSLLSLLSFMICLWQRSLKLQSFGSLCFWASHCFAMDSIELSSILDCFGDQITNKNTKTYTIWLEMIEKVLNMLIGLKGNNYYSKVFKRVNYKVSNRTFWVVIKQLLAVVDFNDFGSWAQNSRCYEQVGAVHDMKEPSS